MVTREEVVGHGKIWKWLYPDEAYRKEITTKAAAIIEKGEVVEDFETVIRSKNGESKTISWNSRNLLDADGNPTGSIALGRNVTERKKLIQQLIQSEKLAAVGTLAYGIPHEFNNVLAGMTVAAEFGLSQSDNQEVRECFQAIAENSQRGSSITNSLLAVAGEKREKKEPIDIIQPLENVLSFSRRELEKANINIIQDFKPVPQIFCDPGELSEVFLNMLSNARDDMTPQGGTLSVKVRPYKDNIRIDFKDTGEGIPEEIKDKIFDPFVTTKGALGKSEVPGTGLGLYVTYGIINSYHGKIDVDSKVGKGTTFTILIPVSKNLPPESVLKKKVEFPEEIKKRLNILLVDDEEVICRTLKRFLESRGHQVTTSLKAEEGLEFFKKDKFDVVLSDITMPGMDGIKFIKEIKEKDKDSKIIAITGHVRKQKLEEAKDAGAAEVLIKPF